MCCTVAIVGTELRNKLSTMLLTRWESRLSYGWFEGFGMPPACKQEFTEFLDSDRNRNLVLVAAIQRAGDVDEMQMIS